MQVFTINQTTSIVCQTLKTRVAFKHTATLIINGQEQETVKICYLNRTWERYKYESVISKLLHKTKIVPENEIRPLLDYLERPTNNFKHVALISKLADVFTPTPEESNEWKKRMMTAGLESHGLSFPDDWGTLSEDEKQKRLDQAIDAIK